MPKLQNNLHIIGYDRDTVNEQKGYPSNSQKRIFGLVDKNRSLTKKSLSPFDSNKVAYMAQTGVNWDKNKIPSWLKFLLQWWRILEVFLAEKLMMRPGDQSYDWIPPAEMDGSYKIDLMSRIPFINRQNHKKETLAIAMQITMASIPPKYKSRKNHKKWNKSVYSEKFFATQLIADGMENKYRRSELEDEFWKINLPDVIAFLAVNWKIRKNCITHNEGWQLYQKWKRTGFKTPALSDTLPKNEQELLEMLAEFVRWTQSEVLINYKNPPYENETLKNFGYDTIFRFDENKSRLECLLLKKGKWRNKPIEVIAKMTYFMRDRGKGKLENLDLNVENVGIKNSVRKVSKNTKNRVRKNLGNAPKNKKIRRNKTSQK